MGGLCEDGREQLRWKDFVRTDVNRFCEDGREQLRWEDFVRTDVNS